MADGSILWATYLPECKCTFPTLFFGHLDMMFAGGGGHLLCLDSETGDVAEAFTPQLGGMGDDIITMAHPMLEEFEYTECNAQPAAQAVCTSLMS